jgi:hypothetical protein
MASRRRRIVGWIAAAAIALPLAIVALSYLESLVGTSYVEDFFRWLGWHEAVRLFLRDLLL